MKSKVMVIVLILFVALFLTTGCAPGSERFTEENPAGFWWGIWHGMIWFITFLMGIFTGGRYTIYEAANNGGWYNFGFLIGIGVMFGGGGLASRK